MPLIVHVQCQILAKSKKKKKKDNARTTVLKVPITVISCLIRYGFPEDRDGFLYPRAFDDDIAHGGQLRAKLWPYRLIGTFVSLYPFLMCLQAAGQYRDDRLTSFVSNCFKNG